MIFYYAVNEHRYSRNNEWVQYMNEDDFKQYKKTINSFIEENNKNDINKDTKGLKNENFIINLANDETNTENGKFCDFFNNFCGCCVRNVKNNNEIIISQKNANRQNDNDLIRTSD